jgi:hypothetical protein
MWIFRTVLLALGLFIVPTMLFLWFDNRGISNSKATGIDAIQAYGPLFVLVGILYLAFGVFLWSPLPKQLLMSLVTRHLNG